MSDLREKYCGACDSGDFGSGSCFCYQFYREIGRVNKKSELPCHGIVNNLKSDNGENWTI